LRKVRFTAGIFSFSGRGNGLSVNRTEFSWPAKSNNPILNFDAAPSIETGRPFGAVAANHRGKAADEFSIFMAPRNRPEAVPVYQKFGEMFERK
jgi:hypothetical protein